MTAPKLRRAIGILNNRQDAALALSDLNEADFDMNRVSAISAGGKEPLEDEVSPTEVKAGVTGLATGGLGGLVGLLGGMVVALVLPGVGAAADAGVALIGTLLGGTVGGTSGSLTAALTNWGISPENATYYNQSIFRGEYLILVEGNRAQVELARKILEKRGIRYWSVSEIGVSQ